MHYRSLLFRGVLITAIASLPIVQSCTNKQDRAGTESDRESNERDRSDTKQDRAGADSDRADTKQDRESTERDRESTESDLELVAASAQAQSYLQGILSTGPTIIKRGYYTTTEKLDRDRYVQNKLIIKNWCVSKNNRHACSILSSLKKSEIHLENIIQMDDIIGK